MLGFKVTNDTQDRFTVRRHHIQLSVP